MIGDMVRWVSRFIFYLMLWVLILSVRWEGRTLFERAHELILENPVAELIVEEAEEFWGRLSETVWVTYAKLHDDREKQEEGLRR